MPDDIVIQVIWPRKLEEVLFKHPGIADVAVVGICNDDFVEHVCACVIPWPGALLTLEDLITFMNHDVAEYELPQHLELFESFPRGPTGEVLKLELAKAVDMRRAARSSAPAQ
jgi:non-ribosomal peptide synthetase component E (peptide arylation enzyme)